MLLFINMKTKGVAAATPFPITIWVLVGINIDFFSVLLKEGLMHFFVERQFKFL